MDEQKIQQNIISFIPEFSGDEADAAQTANHLAKFIGTADSVYDRLNNDEKKHFNNLIKYRLTGTAFTRINRQQIKDYKTLRSSLQNMYSQTYSLNELERNYIGVRQQYGESMRKYGYRLSEALEQYKAGYKTKYELDTIDNAYKKHLDTNSVETFKRGLNNIILREKMVTSTANNLEEIINETEKIEKMLALAMIEPPEDTRLPHVQLQQSRYQPNQVICNYCQRPNHTWNICRTRMNAERAQQQRTNYQPQYRLSPQINYQTYHQTPPYQPQTNYRTQHQMAYQPQTNYQTHVPIKTTNNRNEQSKQNNNFTNYSTTQPQQQQNRSTNKYCSHCKTTVGHTYEECRSKFFNNTNRPQKYNDRSYNNQLQPPGKDNLEEHFSNMRINTIYPQTQNMDQCSNQGNVNGSSQS